jgi:arylsulfatase A-like enzyme
VLVNTTPVNGALRVGDWKLVVNGRRNLMEEGDAPLPKRKRKGGGEDRFELFNLANDPSEKTDLSASNPEKLKQLRERYEILAAHAVEPKSGPAPAGFKAPAVWGETPQ